MPCAGPWIRGGAFPLADGAVGRDTVSMGAVPQSVRIQLEDYLSTRYRPDCDYVDGAID